MPTGPCGRIGMARLRLDTLAGVAASGCLVAAYFLLLKLSNWRQRDGQTQESRSNILNGRFVHNFLAAEQARKCGESLQLFVAALGYFC